MIQYLKDIWENIQSVFATMGLVDYLDILLLAYLIYKGIKIIKETRAEQLIKGIILLAILFFVVNQFQLKAMKVIIETFLNVGIIAILIVFQPELRRVLEKMGRTTKVKKLALNFESKTDAAKAQRAGKAVSDAAGGRVPRKAPVAVPGAGAGPQRRAAGYAAASAAENGSNAARAEGGAAGGQAIVSGRPGLPRPAATEDLYAEGHDEHSKDSKRSGSDGRSGGKVGHNDCAEAGGGAPRQRRWRLASCV